MSFRVRKLLAPLVIILAVQNLEAQTWGQHGVTVHLLRTHTSPFDIHGLHAVNNLGQVVGVTYDGVSVHSTGVFTPGAGVTYLSAAANQSLIGLAINDAGQIAATVTLRNVVTICDDEPAIVANAAGVNK